MRHFEAAVQKIKKKSAASTAISNSSLVWLKHMTGAISESLSSLKKPSPSRVDYTFFNYCSQYNLKLSSIWSYKEVWSKADENTDVPWITNDKLLTHKKPELNKGVLFYTIAIVLEVKMVNTFVDVICIITLLALIYFLW
jgi:hypothetical protein